MALQLKHNRLQAIGKLRHNSRIDQALDAIIVRRSTYEKAPFFSQNWRKEK